MKDNSVSSYFILIFFLWNLDTFRGRVSGHLQSQKYFFVILFSLYISVRAFCCLCSASRFARKIYETIWSAYEKKDREGGGDGDEVWAGTVHTITKIRRKEDEDGMLTIATKDLYVFVCGMFIVKRSPKELL